MPTGAAAADFTYVAPKYSWGTYVFGDKYKAFSTPEGAFQELIAYFSTTPPNNPPPWEIVYQRIVPRNLGTINGIEASYKALANYGPGTDVEEGGVGLRMDCPVDGTIEWLYWGSKPGDTVVRCRIQIQRSDDCTKCVGNPIQVSDGVKIQREVDYAPVQAGGVSFVRQIRSDLPKIAHNYSRVLADLSPADPAYLKPAPELCYVARVRTYAPSEGPYEISDTAHCFPYLEPKTVFVRGPDSQVVQFTVQADGSFLPKAPFFRNRLSRLVDAQGATAGWMEISASDDTTVFDPDGRMLSISDRAGRVQRLTYLDANGERYPRTAPACAATASAQPASVNDTLQCVTDVYGKQLRFQYDAEKRLTAMIDPSGAVYAYEYNEPTAVLDPRSVNRPALLTSVRYPDGLKRLYHYNEAAYTVQVKPEYSLTGISDEISPGVIERFASFRYDAGGRAISTEHAGAVEKYSVIYDKAREQASTTDPLGSVRTDSFTEILGVLKLTATSQPAGAGSAPASATMTYDENGNLASRTDYNGNVTSYTFDRSRNLETKRVEAAGTAQARTISTEWHANYQLPVRVAEPLRTTTFIYDGSANLISKTEQPTADVSGAQGFAATAAGTARSWTYTWNAAGLLLSATGPRTDAIDLTTYAYDAQFNLLKVTNAAGHVTSLSNYDANGRVGRIVDANGSVSELGYNERGWLVSKKVNAELTGYRYDGSGKLTAINLPDGSTVTYSYDAAHRLTGVTDTLGNSVAYTLDAMGNRVGEQVRDPLGVLARQAGRGYDALNRLQVVTGGAF